MLKQRFFTALILIPLVLLGIFRLPDIGFMSIVLLLTLAAAWEWGQLSGLRNPWLRLLYCALIAGLIYTNYQQIPQWLTLFAPIGWIAALGILIYVSKRRLTIGASSRSQSIAYQCFIGALGLIALIPTWLNLITLRALEPRPIILVYFLLLIWCADIAAYFTGKRFGQNKLAPVISPNKTWEGVIGGLLGGLFLAFIFAIALQFKPIVAGYWIALSMVTIIFSIVGDLFESLLKRVQGLKDSGTILPGHGGVLDRIDSLIAAAPIFTLGYIYQAQIVSYFL